MPAIPHLVLPRKLELDGVAGKQRRGRADFHQSILDGISDASGRFDQGLTVEQSAAQVHSTREREGCISDASGPVNILPEMNVQPIERIGRVVRVMDSTRSSQAARSRRKYGLEVIAGLGGPVIVPRDAPVRPRSGLDGRFE